MPQIRVDDLHRENQEQRYCINSCAARNVIAETDLARPRRYGERRQRTNGRDLGSGNPPVRNPLVASKLVPTMFHVLGPSHDCERERSIQ